MLYLAVDADSGMIAAQIPTDHNTDDPPQVGPLLAQIDEDIEKFIADGVYDGTPSYQTTSATWWQYRGGDSATQNRCSRYSVVCDKST